MNCPHCSKALEGVIPKDRFDSVYADRRDLKTKLEEQATALAATDTLNSEVEALQAQLVESRGALTTLGDQFSVHRTITGVGITDPDLVDAVQWAYGRLPEKDRPSLADALTGWRADPATAPSLLRPHLVAPVSPPVAAPAVSAAPVDAGAETSTPAPQTAPAPPTNAGAVPYNGAPSVYTPARIEQMTDAEFMAAYERGVLFQG